MLDVGCEEVLGAELLEGCCDGSAEGIDDGDSEGSAEGELERLGPGDDVGYEDVLGAELVDGGKVPKNGLNVGDSATLQMISTERHAR